MSTDPATPDTHGAVENPFSSYLYLRIQDRMQALYDAGQTPHQSPLEFIAHERQVTDERQVPRPFYRIAADLSTLTGIDVTHESVRRWHRRVVPPAARPPA